MVAMALGVEGRREGCKKIIVELLGLLLISLCEPRWKRLERQCPE